MGATEMNPPVDRGRPRQGYGEGVRRPVGGCRGRQRTEADFPVPISVTGVYRDLSSSRWGSPRRVLVPIEIANY